MLFQKRTTIAALAFVLILFSSGAAVAAPAYSTLYANTEPCTPIIGAYNESLTAYLLEPEVCPLSNKHFAISPNHTGPLGLAFPFMTVPGLNSIFLGSRQLDLGYSWDFSVFIKFAVPQYPGPIHIYNSSFVAGVYDHSICAGTPDSWVTPLEISCGWVNHTYEIGSGVTGTCSDYCGNSTCTVETMICNLSEAAMNFGTGFFDYIIYGDLLVPATIIGIEFDNIYDYTLTEIGQGLTNADVNACGAQEFSLSMFEEPSCQNVDLACNNDLLVKNYRGTNFTIVNAENASTCPYTGYMAANSIPNATEFIPYSGWNFEYAAAFGSSQGAVTYFSFSVVSNIEFPYWPVLGESCTIYRTPKASLSCDVSFESITSGTTACIGLPVGTTVINSTWYELSFQCYLALPLFIDKSEITSLAQLVFADELTEEVIFIYSDISISTLDFDTNLVSNYNMNFTNKNSTCTLKTQQCNCTEGCDSYYASVTVFSNVTGDPTQHPPPPDYSDYYLPNNAELTEFVIGTQPLQPYQFEVAGYTDYNVGGYLAQKAQCGMLVHVTNCTKAMQLWFYPTLIESHPVRRTSTPPVLRETVLQCTLQVIKGYMYSDFDVLASIAYPVTSNIGNFSATNTGVVSFSLLPEVYVEGGRVITNFSRVFGIELPGVNNIPVGGVFVACSTTDRNDGNLVQLFASSKSDPSTNRYFCTSGVDNGTNPINPDGPTPGVAVHQTNIFDIVNVTETGWIQMFFGPNCTNGEPLCSTTGWSSTQYPIYVDAIDGVNMAFPNVSANVSVDSKFLLRYDFSEYALSPEFVNDTTAYPVQLSVSLNNFNVLIALVIYGSSREYPNSLVICSSQDLTHIPHDDYSYEGFVTVGEGIYYNGKVVQTVTVSIDISECFDLGNAPENTFISIYAVQLPLENFTNVYPRILDRVLVAGVEVTQGFYTTDFLNGLWPYDGQYYLPEKSCPPLVTGDCADQPIKSYYPTTQLESYFAPGCSVFLQWQANAYIDNLEHNDVYVNYFGFTVSNSFLGMQYGEIVQNISMVIGQIEYPGLIYMLQFSTCGEELLYATKMTRSNVEGATVPSDAGCETVSEWYNFTFNSVSVQIPYDGVSTVYYGLKIVLCALDNYRDCFERIPMIFGTLTFRILNTMTGDVRYVGDVRSYCEGSAAETECSCRTCRNGVAMPVQQLPLVFASNQALCNESISSIDSTFTKPAYPYIVNQLFSESPVNEGGLEVLPGYLPLYSVLNYSETLYPADFSQATVKANTNISEAAYELGCGIFLNINKCDNNVQLYFFPDEKVYTYNEFVPDDIPYLSCVVTSSSQPLTEPGTWSSSTPIVMNSLLAFKDFDSSAYYPYYFSDNSGTPEESILSWSVRAQRILGSCFDGNCSARFESKYGFQMPLSKVAPSNGLYISCWLYDIEPVFANKSYCQANSSQATLSNPYGIQVSPNIPFFNNATYHNGEKCNKKQITWRISSSCYDVELCNYKGFLIDYEYVNVSLAFDDRGYSWAITSPQFATVGDSFDIPITMSFSLRNPEFAQFWNNVSTELAVNNNRKFFVAVGVARPSSNTLLTDSASLTSSCFAPTPFDYSYHSLRVEILNVLPWEVQPGLPGTTANDFGVTLLYDFTHAYHELYSHGVSPSNIDFLAQFRYQGTNLVSIQSIVYVYSISLAIYDSVVGYTQPVAQVTAQAHYGCLPGDYREFCPSDSSSPTETTSESHTQTFTHTKTQSESQTPTRSPPETYSPSESRSFSESKSMSKSPTESPSESSSASESSSNSLYYDDCARNVFPQKAYYRSSELSWENITVHGATPCPFFGKAAPILTGNLSTPVFGFGASATYYNFSSTLPGLSQTTYNQFTGFTALFSFSNPAAIKTYGVSLSNECGQDVYIDISRFRNPFLTPDLYPNCPNSVNTNGYTFNINASINDATLNNFLVNATSISLVFFATDPNITVYVSRFAFIFRVVSNGVNVRSYSTNITFDTPCNDFYRTEKCNAQTCTRSSLPFGQFGYQTLVDVEVTNQLECGETLLASNYSRRVQARNVPSLVQQLPYEFPQYGFLTSTYKFSETPDYSHEYPAYTYLNEGAEIAQQLNCGVLLYSPPNYGSVQVWLNPNRSVTNVPTAMQCSIMSNNVKYSLPIFSLGKGPYSSVNQYITFSEQNQTNITFPSTSIGGGQYQFTQEIYGFEIPLYQLSPIGGYYISCLLVNDGVDLFYNRSFCVSESSIPGNPMAKQFPLQTWQNTSVTQDDTCYERVLTMRLSPICAQNHLCSNDGFSGPFINNTFDYKGYEYAFPAIPLTEPNPSKFGGTFNLDFNNTYVLGLLADAFDNVTAVDWIFTNYYMKMATTDYFISHREVIMMSKCHEFDFQCFPTFSNFETKNTGLSGSGYTLSYPADQLFFTQIGLNITKCLEEYILIDENFGNLYLNTTFEFTSTTPNGTGLDARVYMESLGIVTYDTRAQSTPLFPSDAVFYRAAQNCVVTNPIDDTCYLPIQSQSMSPTESLLKTQSRSQSMSTSQSISPERTASQSMSTSQSYSESPAKNETKSESMSPERSESQSMSTSQSSSISMSDSNSQSNSQTRSMSYSTSQSNSKSAIRSQSESQSGRGFYTCCERSVLIPFTGSQNTTYDHCGTDTPANNEPLYTCPNNDYPIILYPGGVYQLKDYLVESVSTDWYNNNFTALGLKLGYLNLRFSSEMSSVKMYYTPGQGSVRLYGPAQMQVFNGSCVYEQSNPWLPPPWNSNVWVMDIELTAGLNSIPYLSRRPWSFGGYNFFVTEVDPSHNNASIPVFRSSSNRGIIYPDGFPEYNVTFGMQTLTPTILSSAFSSAFGTVNFAEMIIVSQPSVDQPYGEQWVGVGEFQMNANCSLYTGLPPPVLVEEYGIWLGCQNYKNTQPISSYWPPTAGGAGWFMFGVEDACTSPGPNTPGFSHNTPTQTKTRTHTRSPEQSNSYSEIQTASEEPTQSLSPTPNVNPLPPPNISNYNITKQPRVCQPYNNMGGGEVPGYMVQFSSTGTVCGILTQATAPPVSVGATDVLYGSSNLTLNPWDLGLFLDYYAAFNSSQIRGGSGLLQFNLFTVVGRVAVFVKLQWYSGNSTTAAVLPGNFQTLVGTSPTSTSTCGLPGAAVVACILPFPSYDSPLYIGYRTVPSYRLPFDVQLRGLIITPITWSPVVANSYCVIAPNITFGTFADGACRTGGGGSNPSGGTYSYNERVLVDGLDIIFTGGNGLS